MSIESLPLQQLKQLHEDALQEFSSVWTEGDNNARMYRGLHWTEKQKKQHDNEFRKAYNIPLLATKMNRILSEQRNNRAKWKPKPVSAEDEIGAEIGGYILDYIDELNDFKWIESEVYQDGMTKKYGVLEIYEDYEDNPQGDIILERVSYNEFLWDTNAGSYDLSDAMFMQRFGWFTREQVKKMYPDINVESLYTENDGDVKNWYESLNKKKELIKVVWHYEREKSSKKIKVRDKELSATEYKVYVTCYSGTTILQEKTDTGQSDYPYVVYFSLFDDGSFWSLIDLAKDAQQGFDRFLSMIDKSTVKNIKGNNYEIRPDLLHPQESKSIDEIFNRLSQGGSYVATLKEGAITPLENHNNVSVESNMMTLMQGLLEDLLGGRTFQGLESKQQQTATESKILENAAKMAGMLYLDNLARWKKRVGQLIWKLIPNVYKQGRSIKIIGDENAMKLQKLSMQVPEMSQIYTASKFNPGMGFMKLPMDLGEINADITIDEVAGNQSMKEQQLQQLISLQELILQAMPNSLPMDIEVFIPYLTVDATVKAKLTEYYAMLKAQKEAELKLQQDQMEIEKFDRGLKHYEKKQEQDSKNKQAKIDNMLKIANAIPNPEEQNGGRRGSSY